MTIFSVEKHIFLEDRRAFHGPWAHMYLVLRDVLVDENGVVVSNAYHPIAEDGYQADSVIRSGLINIPSGLMEVFTGDLADPHGTDQYTDSVTPEDRHSTDITQIILSAGVYHSVESAWTNMSSYARTINN